MRQRGEGWMARPQGERILSERQRAWVLAPQPGQRQAPGTPLGQARRQVWARLLGQASRQRGLREARSFPATEEGQPSGEEASPLGQGPRRPPQGNWTESIPPHPGNAHTTTRSRPSPQLQGLLPQGTKFPRRLASRMGSWLCTSGALKKIFFKTNKQMGVLNQYSFGRDKEMAEGIVTRCGSNVGQWGGRTALHHGSSLQHGGRSSSSRNRRSCRFGGRGGGGRLGSHRRFRGSLGSRGTLGSRSSLSWTTLAKKLA